MKRRLQIVVDALPQLEVEGNGILDLSLMVFYLWNFMITLNSSYVVYFFFTLMSHCCVVSGSNCGLILLL